MSKRFIVEEVVEYGVTADDAEEALEVIRQADDLNAYFENITSRTAIDAETGERTECEA